MINILIGILSGIVSGLGLGGGTILIFLLTLQNINQHAAQGANLIFFIPTSIIAIIVNIKNKNIDIKLGITISIAGILGAILGAKLSICTNVEKLRKYFGIFILLIAIHEIYTIKKQYKKEKKDKNNKEVVNKEGK